MGTKHKAEVKKELAAKRKIITKSENRIKATNTQINSENIQTSENSKFSAYGGSTSFSYGILSANASAEHSSEENNAHLHSENMNISMDMAVISLVRPWLNTSIFKLSRIKKPRNMRGFFSYYFSSVHGVDGALGFGIAIFAVFAARLPFGRV